MDLVDYTQNLSGPDMLELKKTREEALQQMHEETYILMLKKGLRHLRWLYFTFRGREKFESDFTEIEKSLELIKEMAQNDRIVIDETHREIIGLETSLYNLLDRKRSRMLRY